MSVRLVKLRPPYQALAELPFAQSLAEVRALRECFGTGSIPLAEVARWEYEEYLRALLATDEAGATAGELVFALRVRFSLSEADAQLAVQRSIDTLLRLERGYRIKT